MPFGGLKKAFKKLRKVTVDPVIDVGQDILDEAADTVAGVGELFAPKIKLPEPPVPEEVVPEDEDITELREQTGGDTILATVRKRLAEQSAQRSRSSLIIDRTLRSGVQF